MSTTKPEIILSVSIAIAADSARNRAYRHAITQWAIERIRHTDGRTAVHLLERDFMRWAKENDMPHLSFLVPPRVFKDVLTTQTAAQWHRMSGGMVALGVCLVGLEDMLG